MANGLFSSDRLLSSDADRPDLTPEEDMNLFDPTERASANLLRKQERLNMGRPIVKDTGTYRGLAPSNLESGLNTVPRSLAKPLSIGEVSSRLYGPKEDKEGVGVKLFDFLFGPEAAVIGIAHDTDGWSWNLDNVKQQWSEQPLWVNALATTSLVGTILFPAVRAARQATTVGKLATKLKAGTSAEFEEIARWQDLGMLEKEFNGKAVKGYADLEPDTIVKLRQQEIANTKYMDMKERARKVANEEELSFTERIRHEFDKRFAQTYNAMIDDAANGGIKSAFHDMHTKLWQNDTVGTILREMPDEKEADAIYAYILGKLAPGTDLAKRAKEVYGPLSEKGMSWANFYYEAAQKQQKAMLKSGFITEETFKNIGPVHLPALNKGTPDLGIGPTTTHYLGVKKGGRKEATGIEQVGEEFVPTGTFERVALKLGIRPRMWGPTLKHRRKTNEDIFTALQEGSLITDPADIAMNGYMSSEILHTNFQFVTDLVTKDKAGLYTAPFEVIQAAGFNPTKMKKLGYISLDNAPTESAAILRRMIAKQTGLPEEALPWIKQEVFDGIFGVDGMMHQADLISTNLMEVMTTIYKTMKTAGSIPTHIQNLTGNMAFLAQAGFNIAKPENIALMGRMTEAFNKIAKINKTAADAGMVKSRALFDKDGILKGIDLGKEGHLDLADEFFDPAVREILEENAFDSVEGSRALQRQADMLSHEQGFTKGIINLYMKGKKAVQVGDKVKWFDGLTKAYLAEDMVPKMTYYVHLRLQGMTRRAAVTEVARRLPMYGTVGTAIKRGRKFAFPWATFPAEAIRITKNNLFDHPLRMIPWLRAPQIMQATLSGMGFAGGPEEVADTKRQLPFWAQNYGTLVGEGGAIAGLAGGGTGGLLGAAAGAIIGKTPGAAYAAGAAGALVGGAAAAFGTSEEHSKIMRGAMLDFLPHSTFMLMTTSPEFGGRVWPWKDAQGMLEQMPAEPLAILKPLVTAFSGETPFGEPVGTDTGSGISKTMAGILGFIAPPMIQKYGFKLTAPDVPLWGDPTGITNISRFLIDTGQAVDPMTGRPGSFTNDFWLNNAGIFKSYAASGEQQIANEAMTEKHMTRVRNSLTKNLDFHLKSGNDNEIVKILMDVQASFSEQYLSTPSLANSKYTEWLERMTERLGQHPKLRSQSLDEINARIRESGRFAGTERNRAREVLLESLRRERSLR